MKKSILIGRSYGSSMNPLIYQGDRLYVERIPVNEIKLGDIVIFYQGRNLIGHRVIKKKKSFLITKGDNLPFLDRPHPGNRILGRLTAIEGKQGRIDLTSRKYFFLKYYLLLASVIPWLAGRGLTIIFGGRRQLIKLLRKKS